MRSFVEKRSSLLFCFFVLFGGNGITRRTTKATSSLAICAAESTTRDLMLRANIVATCRVSMRGFMLKLVELLSSSSGLALLSSRSHFGIEVSLGCESERNRVRALRDKVKGLRPIATVRDQGDAMLVRDQDVAFDVAEARALDLLRESDLSEELTIVIPNPERSAC